MRSYDPLIQTLHETAQGIVKCCSQLHPQPSAPPCLEKMDPCLGPQRTTRKSTAHKCLPGEHLDKEDPSNGRWELHLQTVLQMCEGVVAHLR